MSTVYIGPFYLIATPPQFLVSIKKTTPELCSQCDYHIVNMQKDFQF